MKKLYIIIGLFVLTLIAFGINEMSNNSQVEAATTTVPVTTIPATTTTIDEGTYFYYENYEDLVNQLYDSLYAQVYQDLYDEIINDLDNEFYEEIYSRIEQDISDLLSEGQIQVYVDDFQQTLYDVIDLAETSVMGITAYNVPADEASIGSGVVYKYDAEENLFYLITNYHVVEDATEFEIYFSDESTTEATLLGYDTEIDIAVLTFSGANLSVDVTVSPLGDSDAADQGEFIIAVGNPIGYNFFNSVNLGIISGLNRDVDRNGYINYIQHDAAINSGNSGGPIYNLEGEVIGINVSKYASIDIEGMGFSIPINLIKEVITFIESGTMPANTIMPSLGATMYDLSEIISGQTAVLDYILVNGTRYDDVTVTLPAGITEGLIINQVDENSTFDTILDGGDLLVTIDDYQITDFNSFRDYVYANYYNQDSATIYFYSYDVNTNTYSSTLSSDTITFE